MIKVIKCHTRCYSLNAKESSKGRTEEQTDIKTHKNKSYKKTKIK